MPVRGLSEVDHVQLGDLHLTGALGEAAAGDEDGCPLNGAWVDSDRYDPNPGNTQINAVGVPITTFMPPRAELNAGRPIELRFTRMDPSLIELLNEELSGGPVDITIPLVDGRVWEGKVVGDRRQQGVLPVETTGDHQHFGGQLKEVILRLLATEGDWGEEEEP